ncbi:unnamed protein product [Prunus armeniaca]
MVILIGGRTSVLASSEKLLVDPTDSPALPDVSSNCGYAFHTSDLRDTTGWIIDSSATDHMTFDPNDFLHTITPRHTSIANANGVTHPMTGAGTVALSPFLSLSNTLLVPSLSNKLMSDILTKEIIGRGIKRGGLYYVDDFSIGRANNVKYPSDDKHQQIWLWHRRLGHPSFGYMRHLLPELFSVFKDSDFRCDTCILAKSHRASYPLTRALLISGHVPCHHWDDAVVTVVHLINRMPSGVLNFKTPLQVLAQNGPLPSVLVLTPRIFGCVAFIHLHKNQRSKLDPCALRCVFLGYATHQKGYRCYHPPTRGTYVTLDVTFLESEMFFYDPASNSTLQGEIRSEE